MKIFSAISEFYSLKISIFRPLGKIFQEIVDFLGNCVHAAPVGDIQPKILAAGELVQSVLHFLELLNSIPEVLTELRSVTRALKDWKKEDLSSSGQGDSWLNPKKAAEYMGISASSFDKYRYPRIPSLPSIKGYKVGGTTLFKKSDLDNFIRLYELKVDGVA